PALLRLLRMAGEAVLRQQRPHFIGILRATIDCLIGTAPIAEQPDQTDSAAAGSKPTRPAKGRQTRTSHDTAPGGRMAAIPIVHWTSLRWCSRWREIKSVARFKSSARR